MASAAEQPLRRAPREGLTRLLLVGGGAAHAEVLARIARQRPAGLQTTWLVPPATPLHEALLPAVVAGQLTPEAARLPFGALLDAAQAQCVVGHCLGVDAAQRQVHVRVAGSGETRALPYQLLSLDPAPDSEREALERRMPGAREHALLRYPSEAFLRLWPELLALARRQPVSLAVVGSGRAALELLFALVQRLRAEGAAGSSFTLVSEGGNLAPDLPEGLRRRVRARLRREGIHLLPQRCVGFTAEGVRLDNGALLRCDAPILVPEPAAPGWLQRSGLLAEAGGVLPLDRFLRHDTYPNILGSAGSGSGATLAHNLLALHGGRRLQPHRPAAQSQALLCGPDHALAAWGPLPLQGRWLARRLLRAETTFLARLTPPAARRAG